MIKAVLVLVFGLALLGGAGFGGWTLYQVYIVGVEEAEEKEPEPPPRPVTAFVRLDPIVVPKIGRREVEQFLTVVVTLEVVAERQSFAQARRPLVHDAFIMALYEGADDGSILRGSLVDIAAVKRKLTDVAKKVLGDGVVWDVLIQVVTQRRV